MKLILASASPRRQEILKTITKDFEVIPADVDEHLDIPKGKDYEQRLCMSLAQKKAQAVFDKYGNCVLGADTLVFLDNQSLGKPKSKTQAFEILKSLSGKTHKVITGVALISKVFFLTDFEQTDVTFPNLSDQEIVDYIEKYQPFDKAGAYGIQEIKDIWDIKFQGSYTNVMGLPKDLVKQMLKTAEGYSV
ncbi:MAG TPA: Maf family protein [Clostridia bacterium]